MPGVNKRFHQEFTNDQEWDQWTDWTDFSERTVQGSLIKEEAPYYSLPMQGTGLMKDIAIAIKQKAKVGFNSISDWPSSSADLIR